MTALTNALKKMLNGLAHADAGEYLTARQKSAYLQTSDYNLVKASDPAPVLSEEAVKTSERRRVAMFVGSELPASMMDYIIDTCSSLDHDLSVLTFETSMVTDKLLSPYAERLADNGINMNIAKLSGEPMQGLARYLRSQPEIAFMACKDSGYLGRSYMNGNQANALPVPVVVVVTDQAAAATQPAEQTGETGKISVAS